MMLAKKDSKFYDVSHMMTMLDGHMSSILVGKEVEDELLGYGVMEGKDWYDGEFENPNTYAFHGILGVCEDLDSMTDDPCDPNDYTNDFCVGHQKDIKYIPSVTYTYDDAVSQCTAEGTDWQLWYPETKVWSIISRGVKHTCIFRRKRPTHWMLSKRPKVSLQALEPIGYAMRELFNADIMKRLFYFFLLAVHFGNGTDSRFWILFPVKNKIFQMVDPTNGVSASHYITSGDYTLQAGTGTHYVICEKVLDQYKEEREVCDTTTRSSDITGNLKIRNDAGNSRNLEYVGKTSYKRAHGICQAKGLYKGCRETEKF